MDIEIQKLQRELQKSGKDVIVLPRELVTEVEASISTLVKSPCGSSWHFCVWCNHLRLLSEQIVHDDNCLGLKFIAAISAAESE